jgi:hypothetical protein
MEFKPAASRVSSAGPPVALAKAAEVLADHAPADVQTTSWRGPGPRWGKGGPAFRTPKRSAVWPLPALQSTRWG